MQVEDFDAENFNVENFDEDVVGEMVDPQARYGPFSPCTLAV
jgi:hypothetical protein